jgi:Ser/Thr protein kinase RdoA (MazF antagonist)
MLGFIEDGTERSPVAESLVLIDRIRKRVLPAFGLPATVPVAPLSGGLINDSFVVDSPGGRLVLQRVNSIFSPAVHRNIGAVTAALRLAGLVTPELLPTADGQQYLRLGASTPTIWRLMTYVDGVSFDVVAGPAQAHAAGGLVARFHAALDSLRHEFEGLRANVHDTPRHLQHLHEMLAAHGSHGLFDQVAPLGQRILDAAQALPPLPDVPPRICHGDLKFNNLLFAGTEPPERDRAVCLVDLDTVGPMALAHELGDAWRSWCNRSGEDNATAQLDLDLFGASLEGYRAGLGRALRAEERRALLLGPDWISLELSARFAADALAESYFGWDPSRFATRGEHNLVRARGQLSLHEALLDSRRQREVLLT